MAIPGIHRHPHYNNDYMVEGELAEKLFILWIQNQPDFKDLIDLRQTELSRVGDVDFAVEYKNGMVITYEVKSDRHLLESGNILFEALRIYHNCNSHYSAGLGWSAKSPANFFAIYASLKSKIGIISAEHFRKAFQLYTKEKRPKNSKELTGIKTIHTPTDQTKTTWNILIPMEYIEKSGGEIIFHDVTLYELKLKNSLRP